MVPDHLRDAGARRRVLSQNLLRDASAVRRLVTVSGLGRGDLAVEPGSGDGAVTRVLAARVRHVIAYERDPRYARFRHGPRVTCVEGDFRDAEPPGGPFHVVGNIPFAITADIVRWCLAAPGLRSATMLTQREYALKRTGGHGRWSRLTVLTWPEFAWSEHGRIPRTAFRPRPRVDAAVLRLERRAAPLVPPSDMDAWRATVTAGFTGVGGGIAASLATVHPARRVAAAFRRTGLHPGTAVGHVRPEDWLRLFTHL